MVNLKNYPWKKTINYRRKPFKYLIGKGEQGVLICEPYKSEILPYWAFKTPVIARKSANKIYKIFLQYIKNNEFVGADLARKFLQMGYTRAKRYANYKGGRKYLSKKTLKKGTGNPEKNISAHIFYLKWQQAERNRLYKKWKVEWRKRKVSHLNFQ